MKPLATTAAQLLFRGGLHAIPFMSDERFLAIFERRIARMPNPEAREFLKHMLLCVKRAVTAAPTRPGATRILSLLVSQLFDGEVKRETFRTTRGIDPPMFLVLSPSMRCNLRCQGCYAGEYTKDDDLDPGVLDRVVVEAREMGIYFLTVSGGEPFISRDVERLWEKHPEILFQVYTNGTLITPDVARRLAEYGNVLPCISVEGYERETDARRGAGTYARIMAAMANLRDAGVLFGFSATATRQNNELITSDEFVDFYAAQGCIIGWYFNYVPIGAKPDMSLMPTPRQRLERWERVRRMRTQKPLVLADFWCDGSLVGGCIAAGKAYLHVNNRGEVEPCAFVHFAVDNIRDKSLAEVLDSPFFRAIRRRQPYCSNLLRPCMIIDTPAVLREVVEEGGAHATDGGGEAILNDLAGDLDRYAAEYATLADAAWERSREPAGAARR